MSTLATKHIIVLFCVSTLGPLKLYGLSIIDYKRYKNILFKDKESVKSIVI